MITLVQLVLPNNLNPAKNTRKIAQILMVKAPHGELHCSRDWLQQGLQVSYFLHIHIFSTCAQTSVHRNHQVFSLLWCPAQFLRISHALLRQWAFWQGTEQHTKSAFSACHTVILGLNFASEICTHMWDQLGIQKMNVEDAFELVALYLNVYVILIYLWQLYINLNHKNCKKLIQYSHWKTNFKKLVILHFTEVSKCS